MAQKYEKNLKENTLFLSFSLTIIVTLQKFLY